MQENAKLKLRVKKLEDKYLNLDLDLVHQRNQLLNTQVVEIERQRKELEERLEALGKDVGQATLIYLKIRRAREVEWDLPEE